MPTILFESPPPPPRSAIVSTVRNVGSTSEAAQELLPKPIIKNMDVPTLSLAGTVRAPTDELAARLATALLGHVLFLKGQIPLFVTLLLPEVSLAQSLAGLRSSLRAFHHP
jgi:hypothetical protein